MYSEAARPTELKAHSSPNFSRVQVGVPLSSECPNIRSKHSELSFHHFLPILHKMKILTLPNLFSTYYEAFTSKINGAWASQTHWTSFMQKPPKIILLPERPPQRLYYTYCVRPKPRHRRRIISCCTKQSVKDKR